MENIESTQRSATSNQSTVDFQRNNIFLSGNRYDEIIFNNNTGADFTATSGVLVMRDVANVTKAIVPVWDLAADPDPINQLGDSIGILKVEGEVVMANGDDINCNLCLSGDIDAGLLVLPAGVTLATVVGGKILKDVLTDLGFVLFNVTENSKFDN